MYTMAKVCAATPPYPIPFSITAYDPNTGLSTTQPPPLPVEAHNRCWFCGYPWLVHSHYAWTRTVGDDTLINPSGCTVCQSIEEMRREFYILPDPDDPDDDEP